MLFVISSFDESVEYCHYDLKCQKENLIPHVCVYIILGKIIPYIYKKLYKVFLHIISAKNENKSVPNIMFKKLQFRVFSSNQTSLAHGSDVLVVACNCGAC